jgi:hypothetical protein
MSHDDDTCPHLVVLGRMEAEIARLKAEFEKYRKDVTASVDTLIDERNRLKAEVERLTKAHSDALADFWGIHKGYFDLKAEVERLTAFTTRTIIPNEELQAQVERLTKAGDGLYKSMLEIGCNEMADNFQYDAWWGSMKDWNAAKEGKQS